MKKSKLISTLFTTALALVAGFQLSTARAANPGVGEGKAIVVKVVGAASYVDSKGGDGALREGSVLRQGTSIITGSGASVTLDLGANGEALVVRENSTVSIDTLTLRDTGIEKSANTALDIKRGSVAFNVKKLSASSKYDVKTANGVAGIRGSSGIIFAVGIFQAFDGTILVRVQQVTATGAPAGPVQTFTVTAGNSLTTGGPTTPVVTPIPVAQFEAAKKILIAQTTIVVPSTPTPPRPGSSDTQNGGDVQIGTLINKLSPTTP